MPIAELDPARLGCLGLCNPDLEHAVAIVGRDSVLGHSGRDSDGAAEAAEAALETDEPVLGSLSSALALCPDRERVVVQLDRHLVLGHSRKIESVDELAIGLPDVDGGNPLLRAAAVALEEAVHQTAHLRLQRRQLADRLPANQCCHSIPPSRSMI